MNRNSLGLVRNETASGAIAPYRIVARDAGGAKTVKQAAAAANPICGVSGVRGSAKAQQHIDVYMDDVRIVEFGAAVNAGDPLTADADGKAIPAVPGDDKTIRIIGFALETGGAGVLGAVHITPQTMRG